MCVCVHVHTCTHIHTHARTNTHTTGDGGDEEEVEEGHLASSGPRHRGSLTNNQLVPLGSENFFLKKLSR